MKTGSSCFIVFQLARQNLPFETIIVIWDTHQTYSLKHRFPVRGKAFGVWIIQGSASRRAPSSPHVPLRTGILVKSCRTAFPADEMYLHFSVLVCTVSTTRPTPCFSLPVQMLPNHFTAATDKRFIPYESYERARIQQGCSFNHPTIRGSEEREKCILISTNQPYLLPTRSCSSIAVHAYVNVS